jgi:FKBP-type peptidyl-prolyl cis-trans isomerase (trigger factor)
MTMEAHLDSAVEMRGPAQARLLVAVPWEALEPAMREAANGAVPGTEGLAGFRAGRLPFHPIDQEDGGVVLPRGVEGALLRLITTAAGEHGLDPLGRVDVEIVEYATGEPLRIAAVLDVRPDITLPDLSSLRIPLRAVSVPEDEVEAYLDAVRQRLAASPQVDPAATGMDLDGDDVRAALTQRLLQAKKSDRLRAVRDEVLTRLTTAAGVPVPEGLVRDEVESRRLWMVAEFERLGTSLADHLAASGTTAEQLETQLVTATAQRVRSQLLLDAVADAEDVRVSGAEVSEAVARLGGSAADTDVRRGKALALLMHRVLFVDPAGDRVTLDDLVA